MFVPANEVLNSEIILPCDDYQRARIEKHKQDMEEFADTLVPALFGKMVPVMQQYMEEKFLEEVGDFSVFIALRVQKTVNDTLKERGLKFDKLDGSKEISSSSE